jgi:hypothetical protein
MRGFKAEALNGLCYVNYEASGKPFPAMQATIHTSTTQLTAPVTQQGGYCDDTIIFRWTMPPGTQQPTPYASDYTYGSSSDRPVQFDIKYKFDLEEVKAWDPVTVLPFGVPPSLPYTITYEGPRWLNPSAYIPLREYKLPTDPAEKTKILDQFNAVDWLDNLTDPYNAGVDWLGIAWPGGWIYAPQDMPTPFLATGYYEDSGRELNWEDNAVHMWQLPFCNPLSIYNKDSTLWGKFRGLAFIPFFSMGMCKEPFCGRPWDPKRPWNPETHPYPFRLRSTVQYLNIEVWIYAGMETEDGMSPIKSPRIARARWWFYTQPNPDDTSYDNTGAPFNPYLFLQCGVYDAKWMFPFIFNLNKNINNPDGLLTHETNMALSGFGLTLGA